MTLRRFTRLASILRSTTCERGASVLKKSTRRTGKQKQQLDVDPTISSKLEAANKTASLVAHELNNLLTVIQINTEFLLDGVRENPASAEELDEIQRASRRASILARQLLASSRFEQFDPAVAETSLRKKPPASTRDIGSEPHKLPRVAETILLVEDEASVRGLAKRILAQEGYRVLEASDGAIALRLSAGHVGEIDLVLTDVAMPNLGGRGLVEELRELSPDLRVLFMSGYPKEEIFASKVDADRTPYLQKPFTGESLLAEVRAALGYAN
ncbi:MAG: response regulator [Gemmatimonadaceae bacterium]